MNDIKMMRIRMDEYSREDKEHLIEFRKEISSLMSKARERAKSGECFVCKKACESYCNSHSVPQFCLKRISVNGKVYISGIQKEFPVLGNDQGVNQAGTFRLICRECDSKIFREYETPAAYDNPPTPLMLAEVAMKNYLQLISKRLEENELYKLLGFKHKQMQLFVMRQRRIAELDIDAYRQSYEYAFKASHKIESNSYYLCYYQKLNYTVPVAFQGALTLVSDFDDNMINNIFDLRQEYRVEEIHLAVFPLENTSVIFMFVKSGTKKYRKFYKQLNKLDLADQLSAINYIILSYSENVFLSKEIDAKVFENEKFLDTCQKTLVCMGHGTPKEEISAAISEYSLKKRNQIPNLLSEHYALS